MLRHRQTGGTRKHNANDFFNATCSVEEGWELAHREAIDLLTLTSVGDVNYYYLCFSASRLEASDTLDYALSNIQTQGEHNASRGIVALRELGKTTTQGVNSYKHLIESVCKSTITYQI